MSSQRAKFPGKPVKRFLNGTRTMEDHVSVSYKDRSIDEKCLPAEMVAIEAEIVSRSKIFRDLFGQEDDDNEDGCLGFDQEFANRLKMNHGRIQSEIYSLEVKLQELGVQPSFYKPDVRSSGVNVSSSALARFSTNSHASVTKSTTRTLQAAENTTARQTLAASATFTTPLSPLPLRLVSGAMCNIPITGIPIVRYARDIPTNSGYRSGKFIVEMESDSDTDESDDENVENKFPPVSDLRNQDEPGGTESEKTLVRLNQCPVGLQDSLEYGFPVIIDKSQKVAPPGPLCFRCGSAGIGQVHYCLSN